MDLFPEVPKSANSQPPLPHRITFATVLLPMTAKIWPSRIFF